MVASKISDFPASLWSEKCWASVGASPSALFCFLTQMFGCGSVAQVVLSRGTHGGFLTINLAFGFAVTLGILVAGQVSGKALTLPSVFVSHSIPTRYPIEEAGGRRHLKG